MAYSMDEIDTAAVWGCGPVGQVTIRSGILLGAEQVMCGLSVVVAARADAWRDAQG